jgi:hypothetical protein
VGHRACLLQPLLRLGWCWGRPYPPHEDGGGELYHALTGGLGFSIIVQRFSLAKVKLSGPAHVFLGMLLPQAGGKLFFPAIKEDELTDEEHIETAVNLFLDGLRPER